MKGFFQICFLLLLPVSASALQDGYAKYVRHSARRDRRCYRASGYHFGTSLTFERAGNKLEIPYASIQSYDYSKEVARHLGVLLAMAIGLVKMRQRRHVFRILYRGQGDPAAQIIIFEVPQAHAAHSQGNPADSRSRYL